jgi:hypothetical protein
MATFVVEDGFEMKKNVNADFVAIHSERWIMDLNKVQEDDASTENATEVP